MQDPTPLYISALDGGHMWRSKHGEVFAWPEGRGEGSQTGGRGFQVVKNKVARTSRIYFTLRSRDGPAFGAVRSYL